MRSIRTTNRIRTQDGESLEDLRNDEVGDVVEVPSHHQDMGRALRLVCFCPRLAQELPAQTGTSHIPKYFTGDRALLFFGLKSTVWQLAT